MKTAGCQQQSLVHQLRIRMVRGVGFAIALVAFLSSALHVSWSIHQRDILKERVRDAIGHTLQDPVRSHDLISIKRILQAFSLANEKLEICIKLPNGIVLEQPTCEAPHFQSYPIPLTGEEFQVSVDLPGLDLMAFVGFLFVLASFILLYVITRYLRALSHKITSDLDGLSSEYEAMTPFHFAEHAKAKEKIIEGAKMKEQAAVGELAEQVAHNLYAPLEMLKGIVCDLPELSPQKRAMIEDPVSRVEEIASQLLEVSKCATTAAGAALPMVPSNKTLEAQALAPMIESILAEKRVQFRNRPEIEIDAEISESLVAKVHAAEFKCILSNLIDNAIEAIVRDGKVVVKAFQNSSFVHIAVDDNGEGISGDVLPQLMTKGGTFGKVGGNGIGLYHAKKAMKAWGGDIEIRSSVGVGTTVALVLPSSMMYAGSEDQVDAILVDDEPMVHRSWRFAANALGKKLLSFQSAQEFLLAAPQMSQNIAVYLDSNLGVDVKGEDLAKELFDRGFREIYLTTGYASRKFKNMPWIKGVLGKAPPWKERNVG